MARHMCMFCSASTFSTCVGTKDRSCVKRSKARQPRATEQNPPIYFYVGHGESAIVNGVRHCAVSFCRGTLFLPTVPLSYPKDLKAHLLGKLPCLGPLVRSTKYQSVILCRLRPTRAYVRKLKFVPWLLEHSFCRKDMRISMMKACHI